MSLSSHRAVARVAALLALLSVAAACADSPLSPLAPTSPAFARGGGGKPPKPTPAPTHDPILFIHGYNGNSATWNTMVSRFKADGWTAGELVNWSYNYRQSNATTATIIQQKVDSILNATGATKVDIITHSMGPLSARYYIRNLGGDGKVDALVTLGGANHGTTIAAFCFDASCVEMRPNSTFLANLNSIDETWGTPRYATWWSNCDEVINPHSSALLSGAINTQTACISHSSLHEDAGVYQQVRDLVNTAPLLAIAP
jgi:triacylglycerol lipase